MIFSWEVSVLREILDLLTKVRIWSTVQSDDSTMVMTKQSLKQISDSQLHKCLVKCFIFLLHSNDFVKTFGSMFLSLVYYLFLLEELCTIVISLKSVDFKNFTF